MKIKKGSIVKYKSEYCESHEKSFLFSVHDLDERRNWCEIICLNDGFSMPVINAISLDMVEPTGLTLEKDVFPFS